MEDWRRIDVDQYDPDLQYEPDPIDAPAYSAQQLDSLVTEIRSSVSRGDALGAIKLCVAQPPYGSDSALKTAYLQAVLNAFVSVRQSEIPNIVKSLDMDETDTLVKLLYSLMSVKEGQKSGGVLLGWFDKVVELVGERPIVSYVNTCAHRTNMVVKRGDKFPTNVSTLFISSPEGEPKPFDLKAATKSKKFVVVSVPGAFTPPCTNQHLPEYIQKVQNFASKGVDFILVVTQNDPFVLRAWREKLGATSNKILFVSDPYLDLSKKLGSPIDLGDLGLGTRSSRLALIVNRSGIVEFVADEKGGEVNVSTASKLLAKL
ncbi:hypothetical protein KL951_001222 [Ogataea haglerorum]|nr:hypothetical protein KL951_001222 [Ogataea haglerorum]